MFSFASIARISLAVSGTLDYIHQQFPPAHSWAVSGQVQLCEGKICTMIWLLTHTHTFALYTLWSAVARLFIPIIHQIFYQLIVRVDAQLMAYVCNLALCARVCAPFVFFFPATVQQHYSHFRVAHSPFTGARDAADGTLSDKYMHPVLVIACLKYVWMRANVYR